MIRQIFIAPVKEGVTEDVVQTRIEEMRRLPEHVPGIEGIKRQQNKTYFS